ncbi:MAG TPA: EamA family transporter [Clostridiales bacterium]|nr:EamA family transporter [Clostridiales bacterium]
MIKNDRSRKNMVVLLALFGMICWGIAPVFAKAALKDIDPTAGLVLRTIFAASVVSGWVIISGNFSKVSSIPAATWWLIATEALLATLVGDLAYYAALKKGDVSLVTIVMSSSPLVTILCSAVFLGEQITLMRLVGAILVIAGIILIV